MAEAVRSARGEGRLPLVGLHGKGGVGKSALAVRFAHNHQGDYPDGLLYVDLRTALGDSEAALAYLLRNLGVSQPPTGLAERTAVYRTLLHSRRVAIVLDHARDEEQLLPLLPNSPECLVLVTRRVPFTDVGGSRVSSIDVNVVGEEQSLELLRSTCSPQVMDADPAAARQIARLCGGLPLALKIMGQLVRARSHHPLHWHAQRLEAQQLEVLRSGGDDVAASLALSYSELHERARRTFCLLGLLVQLTFPSWTVAALTGSTLAEAESLLDELVENQLVEVAVPAPDTRYALHDLVRAFAEQQLLQSIPESARVTARKRLVWAYLDLAETARAAIDRSPTPDRAQVTGLGGPTWRLGSDNCESLVGRAGVRWFTWEYPGLSAVVRQQHEAGDWETCRRIAGAAARCAGLFSSTDSWLTTLQLGAAAASRTRSTRSEAQVLLGRAELHRAAGAMDTAAEKLARSVALFEEAGDPYGRAAALRCRADTLRIFGRFPAAAATARQALQVARDLADPVAEARALRHLGFVYVSMHRGADARETLGRALEGFQRDEDRVLEARTLLGLTASARVERRFDDALRLAYRARMLFHDLRSPVDEATAHHELGHVHLKAARIRAAEHHLSEALNRYRGLELSLQVGRVQRNLAWLRIEQRRFSDATDEASRALEIFTRLDSRYWQAQAWWCLGAAKLADGRWEHALGRLSDAEEVFRTLAADWDLASCLVHKAKAQCALGNAEAGHLTTQAAVELFEGLGLPRESADAWKSLARSTKGARARGIVRQARGHARALRREVD